MKVKVDKNEYYLVVPLATFINSKLTISLFVCMSCILLLLVFFGGGGGRGGVLRWLMSIYRVFYHDYKLGSFVGAKISAMLFMSIAFSDNTNQTQ